MSQLTPANSQLPSNGGPPDGTQANAQQPALPELSAETRKQLEAAPRASAPAALPGDPAEGPSHDGKSPDGKFPDLKSPDLKSPDLRSSDHRSPDSRPDLRTQASRVSPNLSQRPAAPGPATRVPNARTGGPERAAVPPGSGQTGQAGRATGRGTQDPDGPDAADDPDTAAPEQKPEVIYIPETPQERDARMRRELADSVCDQYGVAREACRAQTARH